MTVRYKTKNNYQKKGHKWRERKRCIPLKAMPEEATTQVWMTVFSCLVKGCLKILEFSRNFVHVFTKKKPRRPAETLSEGIIPVVRFSFMTMNVKSTLSTKLTTKALIVSCFLHDGTSLPSKALSTENSSASFPPSPSFLSFLSWWWCPSSFRDELKPFSTSSWSWAINDWSWFFEPGLICLFVFDAKIYVGFGILKIVKNFVFVGGKRSWVEYSKLEMHWRKGALLSSFYHIKAVQHKCQSKGRIFPRLLRFIKILSPSQGGEKKKFVTIYNQLFFK